MNWKTTQYKLSTLRERMCFSLSDCHYIWTISKWSSLQVIVISEREEKGNGVEKLPEETMVENLWYNKLMNRFKNFDKL